MNLRSRRLILGLFGLIAASTLVFQNCAKFNALTEGVDGSVNEYSEQTGFSRFSMLPGEFAPTNSNVALGPASSPSNNLQYFGYPLFKNDPEMIPEIENHANALSMFFIPNSDTTGFSSVIRKLNSNLKAIIFINDIFYDYTTGVEFSPAVVNANIQKLKTIIDPAIQNIIYFAFDEPVWRQTSYKCARSNSSQAQIWACAEPFLRNAPEVEIINSSRQSLEAAANKMRSYFPSVGLAVIEGGPMIKSVNPFPRNFDLYGFDCYAPINDCFGTPIATIFRNMREHVVEMNRTYGGFRRLALIPEAMINYNADGINPLTPISTGKTEDEAIQTFNAYLPIYQNDPMVVLIGVWLWETFNENATLSMGSRGLPKLRAHLEEYGRSITRKPVVSWTKPPLIEFSVSNDSRVGKRSTWAWTTTGATSCYSITEPNDLQNLPPNGLIQTGVETVPRQVEYTIGCRGPYGTSQKTLRYTVSPSPGSGGGGGGGGGETLPIPTIDLVTKTYQFFRDRTITPITLTRGGGAISSCTTTPSLPSGLSISNSDCSISGTPRMNQAATNYRIRASNASGYSEITIQIEVKEPDSVLLPPIITFSKGSFELTQGLSINQITVNNTGGVISSCTSSPTLPAGLSLSSTCNITGTPTTVQSAQSYTIRGANAAGYGSFSISLSVTQQSPIFTYPTNSYQLTQNVLMTTILPSYAGGAIATCTISPALPSGLNISNSSCAISGTPLVATGTVAYTVRATNSSGAYSQVISITVNAPSVPAPSIQYSLSSVNLTRGVAMTNIAPSTSGGPITNCVATPSLPSGIVIHPTTCVISGTPTVLVTDSSHRIIATNSSGSSESSMRFTITNPVTPAVFSCTPTVRQLSSYSLDGSIIPASTDVDKPGYFFVAGFDTIKNEWYSFNGEIWTKHQSQLESSFSAINNVTVLIATGISGAIFKNEDLTPFPNGVLFIGYGMGATKEAAWEEMLAGGAARYKLCDTLPAQ